MASLKIRAATLAYKNNQPQWLRKYARTYRCMESKFHYRCTCTIVHVHVDVI